MVYRFFRMKSFMSIYLIMFLSINLIKCMVNIMQKFITVLFISLSSQRICVKIATDYNIFKFYVSITKNKDNFKKKFFTLPINTLRKYVHSQQLRLFTYHFRNNISFYSRVYKISELRNFTATCIKKLLQKELIWTYFLPTVWCSSNAPLGKIFWMSIQYSK